MPYLTPESQAELDAILTPIDERIRAIQQEEIDNFAPHLIAVRKRMQRTPLKYAYEIRTLNRLQRLIITLRYVPESARRIVSQCREMSR